MIERLQKFIDKRKNWLPIVISVAALLISCVAMGASVVSVGISLAKYMQVEKPQIKLTQLNNEEGVYYLAKNNDKKFYTAIFRIKIVNPSNYPMLVEEFKADFGMFEKNSIYGITTNHYKDIWIVHINQDGQEVPIIIDKFLIPPFEVRPGGKEEGYVILQGYFNNNPVEDLTLFAFTPHGKFDTNIHLNKVEEVDLFSEYLLRNIGDTTKDQP
ncbi:MAG: hypothetical protein ABFD50_03995 [Smithella sp.]